MKRVFAILSTVLILLTCAACAKDSVFTFRNGLRWGMTPDEVLAAKNRTHYTDTEQISRSALACELDDLTVSKFTADLSYLLVGGKLAGVHVNPHLFISKDTEAAEYLKQALIAVYGEVDATLPASSAITALMNINDWQLMYGWHPADGTYVGVFNWRGNMRIGYYDATVNIAAEIETGEVYDTTPDTTGL